MSQEPVSDMITNSPDANSEPSESPKESGGDTSLREHCPICEQKHDINQKLYMNSELGTCHLSCWNNCQEIAREAYTDGAKAYNRVLTDKLGKPTYMDDYGERHTVYKHEWVSEAIQAANRETITKGIDLAASGSVANSSVSNPPSVPPEGGEHGKI